MEQILKDNFQGIIISFLVFLTIIYALSLIANYYNNKQAWSQPQADFSSLLGYIKFILTVTTAVIGLMVIVFTTVFWEDKAQLETDSQNAINNVASNATSKLNNLEKNVFEKVDTELIKIFKSNKIDSLVENKAKELAEKKVEKIIDEKMIGFNQNLKVFGDIIRGADLMREGKVEGMKILLNVATNDLNENNRQKAYNQLDTICAEFFGKSSAYYGISVAPDSVKIKIVNDWKTGNRFMYLNNLTIIQDRLDFISAATGNNFNLCNIEDFLEWAKLNNVPTDIDKYVPIFKKE